LHPSSNTIIFKTKIGGPIIKKCQSAKILDCYLTICLTKARFNKRDITEIIGRNLILNSIVHRDVDQRKPLLDVYLKHLTAAYRNQMLSQSTLVRTYAELIKFNLMTVKDVKKLFVEELGKLFSTADEFHAAMKLQWTEAGVVKIDSKELESVDRYIKELLVLFAAPELESKANSPADSKTDSTPKPVEKERLDPRKYAQFRHFKIPNDAVMNYLGLSQDKRRSRLQENNLDQQGRPRRNSLP
jgi:hypothetical protein